MSIPATVSRETHQLLEKYAALLIKWNAKINLVGSEENLWDRHLWDAYQLIQYIPRDAAHLIDLGSGAGLPGLVIAMALPIQATLVERDQRKAAFLKEAARALSLKNVTILNADIADVEAMPYDVVTARALASLDELCALSVAFVGTNSICLFPKGERFATELEAARVNWQFEAQAHASATEPKAGIISLSKLKKIHQKVSA